MDRAAAVSISVCSHAALDARGLQKPGFVEATSPNESLTLHLFWKRASFLPSCLGQLFWMLWKRPPRGSSPVC